LDKYIGYIPHLEPLNMKITPPPPATPSTTSRVVTPTQPPEELETSCQQTNSEQSDDCCNNVGGIKEISESSIFTRPLAITETALDNELIVSDLLTNRSFRLNDTGVDIWRSLSSQQSVSTVASNLSSSFDLEQDAAVKIVLQYAASLLDSVLLLQPESKPN
jgi:hypothetical protein